MTLDEVDGESLDEVEVEVEAVNHRDMTYPEFRQVATDVANDITHYDWSRILMMIMVFFASMMAPSPVVRFVVFLYALLDIWQIGTIFDSKSNTMTTIFSKRKTSDSGK